MPRKIFENHPVSQAWSASGAISLELSPKPYTITRMALVVRGDFTTTATPGTYNDPYDRVISSLSLTGESKTFMNFTNMRAAHFWSKMRRHALRRPDTVGNSATNALRQYGYMFHWGVCPRKLNPVTGCIDDNPFDLTAGIPPLGKGNLTLGGAFAAAAAPGSGWTTNDADFEIYLWGVAPEAGDPPEAWMPRAFPRFEMATPTPVATSSLFQTTYNIPSGEHLHSLMLMLTNGSNAPRDDGVIGSLQVYNQLEGRQIWTVERYKAGEILSQMPGYEVNIPSEDPAGTLGTLTIVPVTDEGIVWLPLHHQASRGHPLYGVDLRQVATGDLQLRYGVDDATGVTFDVVHTKYVLNGSHPANAGA